MFETGLIRFIRHGDRFYQALLVKQLEPNTNEFQELGVKLKPARRSIAERLAGWRTVV